MVVVCRVPARVRGHERVLVGLWYRIPPLLFHPPSGPVAPPHVCPREGCTFTCVNANICPCARVNAVSGPFFRQGGLRPPSQMLSLRVYNMCTVSTTSRPCLFVVHSVYRLYSGQLICAQCLQRRVYVYAYAYISGPRARRRVDTRAMQPRM